MSLDVGMIISQSVYDQSDSDTLGCYSLVYHLFWFMGKITSS